MGYCLFVAFAVVALKLWVAQDIKASAFFADDYLYLNQSPYYLRGDVTMESYPHGQVYAGVVYPLVLSPWLLADDPAQRIYIVHVINILLSGVTVFFGSRIVARLSNSSHLLPSLCLAAMPTLVIFSFHAMTENLVFAMFMLVGWLVIDFEDTCRRPNRLLGLLFLVMLLPQVRAPGIAVVPGLVLLVWLHRRHLGRQRAWLIVAGLLSAPLAPYLAFAAAAPPYRSHAREFYYFEILSRFANEPASYGLRTLRLVGNQLAYLLVGSGYWILPVLLTVAVQVRRWAPGVNRDRWRDYLLFAGTSSLMVLAFCVWHLLIVIRRDLRLHGSFEPGMIYGRYNDPAMLLILVGGLAAALVLQRPRWEGALPYVVAPIGLYLSLRIINPQKWMISSQQTGLVWFEGAWYGPTLFLLGMAGAVAVLFLTPGQRWRAPVWMGALLVYFAVADVTAVGTTDHPGSMRRRAARIAHTQEAAGWIHRNVPESSCIGCDGTIIDEVVFDHHLMRNVYQTFFFSTYPRPNIMVESEGDLQRCDYFFTKAGADHERGLPVAWSDGDFTLYRVPPQWWNETTPTQPAPTSVPWTTITEPAGQAGAQSNLAATIPSHRRCRCRRTTQEREETSPPVIWRPPAIRQRPPRSGGRR